jgi:hypothetical protein
MAASTQVLALLDSRRLSTPDLRCGAVKRHANTHVSGAECDTRKAPFAEKGGGHLASLCDECAGHQQAPSGPSTPRELITLKAGDLVHGYVRSAAPQGSKGAGVFVSLSAAQHGRAQLRALAAHFVDDPAAAFPEGRHVQARVLEVKGDRIELSLKAAQAGRHGWLTLPDIKEGQVSRGR